MFDAVVLAVKLVLVEHNLDNNEQSNQNRVATISIPVVDMTQPSQANMQGKFGHLQWRWIQLRSLETRPAAQAAIEFRGSDCHDLHALSTDVNNHVEG